MPLKYSFLLLTPQHPSLLQCRIQSPVTLRNMQINLVCSKHMTLVGQCYDRAIGEQLFQKDILPWQFNAMSWRIDMQQMPPPGTWLCGAILTASLDTEQATRHELLFEMP